MVLILLAFIAMCLWRNRQQNNMHSELMEELKPEQSVQSADVRFVSKQIYHILYILSPRCTIIHSKEVSHYLLSLPLL